MRTPTRLPLLACLFCTILWGCAAAFVSGSSINPGTLQALSSLVQAPILFAIARPRRATIAATPWTAVLRIGACSAVICACYFFSLRLAPPALASALHLTAPVILLSVALARGRRAPSAATMAVMVLLVAGLVASMAGSGLSGAGNGRTLLGMALALGSAGVIACSVTMMNRHGGRGSSTLNAAIATTVSGLPFLPFLVLSPPSAHDVLVVAVVTVCCWVPACLSNWWATPRIAPTLGTSIGLNEALVTGAVAWAVLGDRLAPVQLAGGLAVGLAVLLEARIHVVGAAAARLQGGAPRRGGGHGRPDRRPASRGIVVRSCRRVTRPVRVRTRARRIARA
ncbi:MAG: hypothetical protein QOI17_920 [Gaiellales bacterium]|nr:hypothetical protein [Gaiellales bacterium]